MYVCIFFHPLTLILAASIMLYCFRPNTGPFCYLHQIKFHFKCLYCIHKQFWAPQLSQIALSFILGHCVIHFATNSPFSICIISINKIHTCYSAEIKCHSQWDKILIAKSINNIPIHLLCIRFCFLI